MIYLEAQSLGIRFGNHWLFRHLSFKIEPDAPLAILGANGSGKSTLIKMLTGFQEPSEGKVVWKNSEGTFIPEDTIFKFHALAAPYLELFEELTLKETFRLHHRLKPLNLTEEEILELGYFQGHEDKPVKQFSSGMKQRLKLLLAFGSAKEVLFLDEPCSNLDVRGKELYRVLIDRYMRKFSIVVASNDPEEYYFCSHHIEL